MKPFFLNPQHPKSNMRPDPEMMKMLLGLGWAGQAKINGARTQIHISCQSDFRVFTRQGSPHTVEFPAHVAEVLKARWTPTKDWTVLDAEWERFAPGVNVHLFDILKLEGVLLQDKTYKERHGLLVAPPSLETAFRVLPLLLTLEACQEALEQEVEGLVFKSLNSLGWPNTAIVRMLKKDQK